MARRFLKEITALLLLAACFGPQAWAKEEFVPYTEAQSRLNTAKPPERGAISIDELSSLMEKGTPPVLFDARSKKDYDAERLPGARMPRSNEYYEQLELFRQNITRTAPNSRQALEKATEGLDRQTPVVTYCRDHCGLSKTLMLDLQALGFTDVRWLEGGIDVWREKGHPVEKS